MASVFARVVALLSGLLCMGAFGQSVTVWTASFPQNIPAEQRQGQSKAQAAAAGVGYLNANATEVYGSGSYSKNEYRIVLDCNTEACRVQTRSSCRATWGQCPATNPSAWDFGGTLTFSASTVQTNCTAGTVAASGYFDIGTSQGASPKLLACNPATGGYRCEVVFDGASPSGSAIVAGQKHWYAKGEYIMTGNVCPSGAVSANNTPGGTQALPADSCAPGDAMGTVNGKSVCVSPVGDGSGAQTDGSTAKSTTTTSETTVTNADGSTTRTITTVETAPDGTKKTTVEKITTPAGGGAPTSSKEETVQYPAGKGPSVDDSKVDDGGSDGQESPCAKNPSGQGCGGAPAPVGSLYTAKTKTMASVFSAAQTTITGSPAGSAVSNFFSVSGGGSCPVWSTSLAYFHTTLTMDQMCSSFATSALAILRIAVLLAASFFAFCIALE